MTQPTRSKPIKLKDLVPEAQEAPQIAPEALFPPLPEPTPVEAPKERSEALQQAASEAFQLPYEPPMFDFEAAARSPEQELAMRELCRRRLLPFIQRFRPQYSAGWVHADICRRLERFVEQIEQKKSPRLLLMMPVRHGKSEICSRHFPPWLFGKHPEWEIIAASGAQNLALSFSRYGRDVMRDPAYSVIFPETRLDPSTQSVENWNTTKGGGYLAAGIGSMITGRGSHCFPAGVRVSTPSGYVNIEHLKPGDKVLGYDNNTNRLVETYVKATKTSLRDDLVRVRTVAGRSVVCTGDHPFYVDGAGYVEAKVLGVGAGLLVSRVPELRSGEAVGSKVVPEVFPRNSQGLCGLAVQFLRQIVQKTAWRVQEIVAARSQGQLLLEGVFGSAPCCEKPEAMPGVQRPSAGAWQGQEREVLLGRVSEVGISEKTGRHRVPGLFDKVSSSLKHYAVLLVGVFKRRAFRAYAWGRQLELQRRSELQSLVPHGSLDGVGKRWFSLRGVRRNGEPCGSSHQSSTSGQPGGELDHLVSDVSWQPPQVAKDTVSLVEEARIGYVEVHDIQVEGTSNFFAEEILVHNCLIIDDPVRDAQAADSATIRDNVWEWYMSTAYTRLAPGGGVLGIMTTWNEDDWAGRIQQVMRTGDGDMFEIVRYPAINDIGDEYLLPNDSIEQFPEGSDIPEGARLLRLHNSALHPNRYPLEELKKKKANYVALGQKRWWDALFQQNPLPEDGDYFTPSMFNYYSTQPARADLHIYQAWDFAISTDQKNDYTVGTTIGVDHRGSVYVLDVRRFKSGDSIIIADTIVDYAKEYDPVLIGFEDGQIWRTLEAQFLRSCENNRAYPSYEVLKPLTDKLVRASPLRGQMQAGKVFFDTNAHWFGPLYQEFLRFGAGGVHDDQVDSLSWAIRLTLSRAAPKRVINEPKLPSWRDRLNKGPRSGLTHMAS